MPRTVQLEPAGAALAVIWPVEDSVIPLAAKMAIKLAGKMVPPVWNESTLLASDCRTYDVLPSVTVQVVGELATTVADACSVIWFAANTVTRSATTR